MRNTVDISKHTALQIIFSTESDGQFVANVPISIINMDTKESCLACLTILFHGKFSFLQDGWKDEGFKTSTNGNIYIPEKLEYIPVLTKISMCITYYNGIEFNAPEWYNKDNGKIYLNQIKQQ